jgi:hypothetical protein
MGELIRFIQNEIPWSILFVDDIVVDETRCGANTKLETWRDSLESNGLG